MRFLSGLCVSERRNQEEQEKGEEGVGGRDKYFNFLVLWEMKEAGLILLMAVCCLQE